MKNLIYYTMLVLFLSTSCKDDDNEATDANLFVAPTVSRTVTQIALVDEMTVEDDVFNANLELDFYRNEAYEAGLSTEANREYYTFMVINPNNAPNASAPLWIYLHGGAQGYFDEQGVYQTNPNQDEHTWNHEESFDDLWWAITVRTIENGQLEDNTLKRRMQEGYRILVVSYSDHDWYSGLGTAYPNNPANPNAQVNGLQATMAAIDYTADNYPTTHAWLHGTSSAGAVGVWSVALSYEQERRPINGLIEMHFLPNTGHVPTNNEGPANDLVNNFIDKVLASNPPPFGM